MSNKIGIYGNDDTREVYLKPFEDDSWSEYQDDMKKHGIYYNEKGVSPIKIIKRENQNPLFVIGYEDDGVLGFKKENGYYVTCKDVSWIDDLINNLEFVKKECEEVKRVCAERK